jgi:hypothetical protein
MKFTEWRYLYPPRPENAISKALLGRYEKMGYIGQAKLNGTCSVLGIAPGRESIKAMTRHNDIHKAWSPSGENLRAFQNLPGSGWYVFVAELLHSKGNFKNINYIHEILVADGEYLLGYKWQERQDLLQSLFMSTDDGSLSHKVIDENTWLVKNFTSGLPEAFDALVEPYYEGLVLKDPNSRLKICTESGNSDWQVKARKPAKNYSF